MSTDINTTGKTVLMRLPNFHTLDVGVERRIARVTINNSPINLMDATMLGELDQLAGWLATQGDAVRVVIFQSAIPDFFLAHLGLGLIQAIVDDPDPDVALESFQGLVARYRALDQVTIAKVAGRVGGGGALSLVLAILSFRHFGDAYAVLLLSLWIGIGFIFLGVSENAVAVNERDWPGRGLVCRARRHVHDRRRHRASLAVRFHPRAYPRFRCVTGDPQCYPDRAGIPDPQGHQGRVRNVRGAI
jgi:hypothetical protein